MSDKLAALSTGVTSYIAGQAVTGAGAFDRLEQWQRMAIAGVSAGATAALIQRAAVRPRYLWGAAGLSFGASVISHFATRGKEPNLPLLAGSGVFGAAGIALLLESFRRTVDCEEFTDAEAFGVPIRITYTGSAKPGDDVPTIISFHSMGATEKGAASFSGLDVPARVIRPRGGNQLGYGSYGWTTLASRTTNQDQWEQEMRQAVARVLPLVRGVRECLPGRRKPIVTGSSQGGHMAYALANYPDDVAGAVALLGYLPQGMWSCDSAPVVGLHTTGDATVPYSRTKTYWNYLDDCGSLERAEAFSGGHTVTSSMSTAWRKAIRGML